jgi:predicted transcriptional regulator
MDESARYDIMAGMTKKLEDAITKVRELPEDDQDMAADVLLSMIAEPMPLDEATRSAIREGLDQARRGEFVPDEEIQALWKRHGL